MPHLNPCGNWKNPYEEEDMPKETVEFTVCFVSQILKRENCAWKTRSYQRYLNAKRNKTSFLLLKSFSFFQFLRGKRGGVASITMINPDCLSWLLLLSCRVADVTTVIVYKKDI